MADINKYMSMCHVYESQGQLVFKKFVLNLNVKDPNLH